MVIAKRTERILVNIVNEPIVFDNNVITSYCPETAPGVAFKLLELLTPKEKMESSIVHNLSLT